jgi:hypothetical protein
LYQAPSVACQIPEVFAAQAVDRSVRQPVLS